MASSTLKATLNDAITGRCQYDIDTGNNTRKCKNMAHYQMIGDISEDTDGNYCNAHATILMRAYNMADGKETKVACDLRSSPVRSICDCHSSPVSACEMTSGLACTVNIREEQLCILRKKNDICADSVGLPMPLIEIYKHLDLLTIDEKKLILERLRLSLC